jgi:hypothetical protein
MHKTISGSFEFVLLVRFFFQISASDMCAERTERDLINGRFWFRESYGYESDLPKPEYAILFLKTILHVAGADGIISEPERDWVVGFAGVCGQ